MVCYRAAGAALAACAVLSGAAEASAQCLSRNGAGNAAEGAALGSIVGAILGGTTSDHNRAQAQRRGAVVGGLLGAGVGCWTAHEQAVVAARERALQADTGELMQLADNLDRYNDELAAKVIAARQLNDQLRDTRGRQSNTVQQLAARAAREREAAAQELSEVGSAMRALENSTRNVDRNSPRFDALRRQYAALSSARSQLAEIEDLLG